MITTIKKFIEAYIDLIEENNFEALYNKAFEDDNVDDEVYQSLGEMTDELYACDIDPLEYMTYIPCHYLTASRLTEISVPAHINELVMGCCSSSNLNYIELPEGITEIPGYSFYDCYNMESILIPKSVKFIDRNAFSEDHIFKVKCYEGSYADKWADEHGLWTEFIK